MQVMARCPPTALAVKNLCVIKQFCIVLEQARHLLKELLYVASQEQRLPERHLILSFQLLINPKL